MSIQLLSGEKVIRSYDYEKGHKVGVVNGNTHSNNLTITNKRIIHTRSQSGRSGENLGKFEMPLEDAKYINASCRLQKYPILILLGILFAVGAVAIFIYINTNNQSNLNNLLPLLLLIVSIIYIIIGIVKKDYVLECRIHTDKYISGCFNFRTGSYNTVSRGFFRKARVAADSTTLWVSVKVNGEIGMQMAEELGYVITAAQNGEIE